MDPKQRECPLCHGEGIVEREFLATYDLDVSRVKMVRRFYRCLSSKCGAAFYVDDTLSTEDNLEWEEEQAREEREMAERRTDLTNQDIYQSMRRAREESNDTITKDRDIQKQVRAIDEALAQDQELLDSFHRRMRNFQWEDRDTLQDWVTENWLPPSFIEKNLEVGFGMSRPALRKDLPAEQRALLSRVDETLFSVGDPVVHETWGQGTVVEGNSEGSSVITAEFPDQGAKRLDLRFAPLRRAG